MNLLRSIHETAAEYSVLAGIAAAKGLNEQSKTAYRIAFDLEKEAATNAPNDVDTLSRFLLLRSAAALAFKAGLFEESERLIEHCRAENPPQWIENELVEIEHLMAAAKGVRPNVNGKALHFEGILTEVNTRQNEITVEDLAGNQTLSIITPRNQLPEIFTKFWDKKVAVQTRQNAQGGMVLENIAAAA